MEYHINSCYINSLETFIYAVFGCIYSELLKYKKLDLENCNAAISALDSFARNMKTILIALKNPEETFLRTFDMLEACHGATAYNKIQDNADELVKNLKEQIIIYFDDNHENVMKYMMGFLPNFHDKIVIKI